jgi:hypothetical protein
LNQNNQAFTSDPVAFLKKTPLHPNPAWGATEIGVADGRDLVTGIQSFDILDPDTERGTGIHQLKFWDRGAQMLHLSSAHETVTDPGNPNDPQNFPRKVVINTYFRANKENPTTTLSGLQSLLGLGPKVRKTDEAPIQAHWLPFRMNRTFEMDLVGGPRFFFTAGLSGCTVVVAGDPTRPHVAHINRMDGPELRQMMDRFVPKVAAPTIEARPDANKSETTLRQMMHQELKAAVAARDAGVSPKLTGRNFGTRDLDDWAVKPVVVGGAVQGGPWIYGVCDFERHYSTSNPMDVLASVTGYRKADGNWRFIIQKVSTHRGALATLREEVTCLVCKNGVDYCTCP